jgi:hypothetical protein
MSFSELMSKGILDSVFRETGVLGALATPITIYVGLSIADPTSDGSGNDEPAVGDYARVVTATTDWGVPTTADPSVMLNAAAITFPTVNTTAWGTVTYFTLWTATTAGTYLGGGVLTPSKAPTDGDTPRFAIGELSVTLT